MVEVIAGAGGAVTVAGTVAGHRAYVRARYQRCLRNIARLEIETGIVPAPPVIHPVQARWEAGVRGAALSYSAPPPESAQRKAERDRPKLNVEWAKRVFGK